MRIGIKKSEKGFTFTKMFKITVLMLSGLSIVSCGFGDGAIVADIETALNVVDGPVKNAKVYILDDDGKEILIGDTNSSGQIVIKNSNFNNLEGNVTLKTTGGNDEHGAIDGFMYSPIMPVDELKKLISDGATLYITPTSSNLEANAFYFYIGTVAYNLFLLFKQILDKNLQKHTVKTIRYKLYNIASKVISHSREVIVKVNEEFIQLLQVIRQRAYEESLQG